MDSVAWLPHSPSVPHQSYSNVVSVAIVGLVSVEMKAR